MSTHISFSCQILSQALQKVIGIVERRQALPILSHVLLESDEQGLQLSCTDLETTLVARIAASDLPPLRITVAARKLHEICRQLPADSEIVLQFEERQLKISSGKSHFSLATLPVEDFPVLDKIDFSTRIELDLPLFFRAIEKTAFAMAQQDVRFYLNGLLIHCAADTLYFVASDGHRMAVSKMGLAASQEREWPLILPRKAVLELSRQFALGNLADATLALELAERYFRLQLSDGRIFTSKLIDAVYPDFKRVVDIQGDKKLLLERQRFQESLRRVSILANERNRIGRFLFHDDRLGISCQNQEQEQARDEIAIDYKGEKLEIGFNLGYLMDVIQVTEGEQLSLTMRDGNSSCLLESGGDDPLSCRYVIMPVRLDERL